MCRHSDRFAGQCFVFSGLLIADEPTTGLDCDSAFDVVVAMKSVRGATNICTIHQPSSELFHLFDDILFMAEGGRVAYFGPVHQCPDYFASIGLTCPSTFNPADFYINCLAVKPTQLQQSSEDIDEICRQFSLKQEASVLEENG